MATLSDDQVKQLLVKAGFSTSVIPTMVGIAHAESGLNPQSHNTNASTGDNSYGLFQINMLGSMGPARLKQFGLTSNDQLFDPQTNANAAYKIYKSQGLHAWTTYTNDAYKKYVPDGTVNDGSADVPAMQPVGDQYGGISGAIESVGKNIFKGIADVIGIVLAIALLIGGIIILMVQSKTGKSVVNTVKDKVIP